MRIKHIVGIIFVFLITVGSVAANVSHTLDGETMSAEIMSCNSYDLNCDCVINAIELNYAITDFLGGELGAIDLNDLITYFLNGEEYCTETGLIEIYGSGHDVTSKFELEEGLSIFTLNYDGSGYFGVWLLDGVTGEDIELLANEIGSFDGSKAVGIPSSGTYVLDINADSPWSITIEQPRPTTAQSVPLTLTGTGQEATQMFYLDSGLTTFDMNHDGSGYFGVWLLDHNGEYIDLLANDIGIFDGSKAVGMGESGICLFDISADGPWSITIEQPRPSTAQSVPLTLTGTGQEATRMFYLDSGLTTFDMNHDGSGHFGVWLLDNNGEYVDLLANDIGIFDGSTAVGISKSGIYLLDISADGNWEVYIEQ